MFLPLCIVPPRRHKGRTQYTRRFSMELLEDRSLMTANLQLLSINAPNQVNLDSSPPAHISWEVINNGDEIVPNDFWFDSVYLSSDQTLDDSDTLLDFTAPIAPQLAPFESYTGELNVTIPHVDAGTWYLIVAVDDDQLVEEASESDNALATPITITWPDVDLTSQFVSQSPLNSVAGDSLLVTWQVNNLGSDYALAPRTDRLYLSTDDFLDLGDTVIYEEQRYDGVAGGIFTQGTASIALPGDLGSGTYYLFIVADDNNDQIETEEFNNGNAIQLNVVDSETNVDLVISDITVPVTLVSSVATEISYQLQNLGTNEVSGTLAQSIYLSYDQTLDLFDDQLIWREDESSLLPIGSESVTVTHDFVVYPTLYGELYLLIVTDSLSNVAEDDETNNVTAVPIKVIGNDLTVNNVEAPTVVGVGTTTTLNFNVTNTGFLPSTSDYWSNGIYLSTDDVLDGTDTLIGSQQVYHGSESSPLNPSDSDHTSIDWLVPDVPSGTYYLIFVADIDGEEPERVEDNNYVVQAIDIGNGPDLTVSDVTVASPILLGSTVNVSYTISNIGSATADPVWFEQIFLSNDEVWDSSDVQVTNLNYSANAPIAVGESIEVTRSIAFIKGIVGSGKYLLVRVIGLPELNDDNNVGSVAVDTVAPDVELLTLNAPTNAVVSQQVNVSWTGKNVGTVSAVAQWADGVYLSTDQTFDASDTLLANSFTPDVSPLDPGESYSRSINVFLPKVPAGTYYLIVSGLVSGQPDSDRSNNVIVSDPLSITVPDLIVSDLIAPTDAVLGDTIAVSYTVTNSSSSAMGANSLLDQFYLSDDAVYQSSDTFLTTINVDSGLPLAADASYTKNLSLRLNIGTAGSKYLIVRTDVANQQGETDETNNYRVIPISLTAPDLVVSDATAPSTASVGRSIAVSFVVKNNSAVPAPASWTDYIQMSSDPAGLLNNVSLRAISNNRTTPLAPGESYTVNANITIPNNTAIGQMYLRSIANFDSGRQPETDSTNNVLVLPISIVQDAVNLEIVGNNTPSTFIQGQFVDVSYSVKNTGTISTFANWFDNVYLSTNSTFDNSDRFVLSKPFFNGPINPGETVVLTGQVYLSNLSPGPYYLLYVIDVSNSQPETNETDNLLAVPIQVVGADLTMESVVAPATASFGTPFDLTYTVNNSGSATATGSWTDRITVISDLDGSVIYTQSVAISNANVAAGESYSRTVGINVPSDFPSGSYHIRVDADYSFSLGETDDSNNVGASDAITLTLPPTPDLIVSAVSSPAQAFFNQSILVSWTITNSGPAPANGTWVDRLVWVSGSDFYEVGDFAITKSLGAGESVDRSLIISAPPVPGNWKLQVRTNVFQQIPEGGSDENNLNLSATMSVIAPIPDLTVTSVTPPIDGVLTGQPVQVTFTVKNQGASATLVPNWSDYVLFSQDPNLTFGGLVNGLSDQLINNQPYRAIPFENPVSLAPGESYTQTVTLPLLDDAPGTWYAYVATDGLGSHFNPFPAVPESDESNNFLRSAGFSVAQAPTANLEVTSASAISTTFSGQPISITWTTKNTGFSPTRVSTWTDSIYLSTDNAFDFSDIFIGSAGREGSLAAGESYTTTQTFKLPEGIQGEYYLLIVTDSGANVLESPSEFDNVGSTPKVQVILTPPPDLLVQNLSAASSGSSGNTIVMSFDVTNTGSTPTTAYLWKDAIYLSQTPFFEPGSSLLLKEISHLGNLGVDEFYSIQTTVDLPADADGQYYLIVVTDYNQSVFELNRSNNVFSNPFFVQLAPANLVVSSVNAPSSILAGGAATLQWTVSNTGIGSTGEGIWNDAVYFIDNDSNTPDVLLASVTQIGTVAVGDSYTSSVTVSLPFDSFGQGRIVVVTDVDDNVFEGSDEDDNSGNSVVSITPTSADLVVTAISSPSGLLSGDQLSLSWTVQNAGGTAALGSWLDDVYLSTDDVFDDQDTFLKSLLHEGGLTAGGSYIASANVEIPITIETGSYYILIRTDHPTATVFNDRFVDRVFEFGAEENNVAAVPLAVTSGPTPDFVTSAVISPSIGYQQGSIDVSWTVTNNGSASALKDWGDAVYLSYDQVFDRGRDILLGYAGRPLTLGVGESYTNTLSVELKNYPVGQAYIFVVADVTDNIFERNGDAGNTALGATSLSILPAQPVDLVVGNITIPSSGVAGTNVSITYTVSNNSSNASTGQWTDAIYLSTDGNWDSGDIFLGRVKHTTGVGANSSYTETLIAPLPGVDPGLYRVILRTDAKSQISETNEANNLTASIDTMVVDVPEITTGVVATGTIATGQYRYYKINVPPGQTLRFTLTGAAASSGALLFASYGSLPSISQFDDQAISRAGKAELVIPATSEGTYYVLVATPSTAARDYSLVAEVLPFGITSISNSTGGAGGAITLEVEGAGFTTGTKLELVRGDTVLVPTWMFISDSAHIYATFDLAGQPLGKYDVHVYTDAYQQVVDPDTYEGDYMTVRVEDFVLTQGFEVVVGEGAHLETQLLLPSSVLANRVFPFQFIVRNTGTNDAEAPVYLIESPSGTSVSLDPSVSSDTPTWEQFVVAGGRRRMVLAPGELVTVTLYALASSSTTMYFGNYIQSENMPTTPINWDELESYYRNEQTDDVWATTWTNFKSLVGTTWESLYDALRLTAADRLGVLNQVAQAVSAGDLVEDLLARAEAGQSDASGFYYQQSGIESGFQVEDTPLLPTLESSDAFVALKMLSEPEAQRDGATGFLLDIIESEMRNAFGPTLRTATGSFDVSIIFNKFLDGSSANRPLPQVLRNGSDSVEGANLRGFKNSQTTVTLFNDYVIPLIRQNIQKAVDEGKIGKGGGTFKVDMFSEGSDFFPNGFGDFKLNYSKNFDIPGLLAGGTGGGVYGPDKRKIEGTVTLKPKTDKCGHTTFDATFDLRMQVDDTFDFVDGNLGSSPLVQAVTSQLRLLEGNDRAFGVQISAQWNVDIVPIPNVASMKDDKKPPKQPPMNQCQAVPPDPDCNAGPSAAAASSGAPSCPDRRHKPDNGAPVDPRTPNDPNDITGPAGYGPDRFVSADSPLAYTIHFENVETATAAARSIVITTQLDSDLDWTSFRLGSIEFSNTFVNLSGDNPYFATRLDLTATRGIFVDVAGSVDVTTGIATWTLTAIDPATGESPSDPAVGVLPPNEIDGVGEGFVTFFVNAKDSAVTGDRIDAQATIVFDTELPILTPAIFNTIDIDAPASSVQSLPETSGPDIFVQWSGIDADGGAGVSSYDIYVSVDGSDYSLWLANTSNHSAVYRGEVGKNYAFYSIAKDGVGNVETKSPIAEASTSVDVGLSVAISGPQQLTPSQAATYSFNVSFTNLATPPDHYLLGIDWNNDGINDDYSSDGAPITVNHSIPNTTDVVITFYSSTFVTTVHTNFAISTITSGTATDPDSPGIVNLYWNGTANDDWYQFTQLDSSSIRVDTLSPGGGSVVDSATFTGITGRVFIDAGLGNDRIDASAVSTLSLYIDGGSGDDTITGGASDDVIDADGAEGQGSDWIDAGGGNDVVHSDATDHRTPSQNSGRDTVSGGQGNDTIYGDGAEGSNNDFLNGDEGDDLIVADGEYATWSPASEGQDSVAGGIGRDVIVAGIGIDHVSGDQDSDLIISGRTRNLKIDSLQLIQSEWLSARPLNERAENILGIGVGPRDNGLAFLNAATVTLNDSAVDTIFGGNDEDWFIADESEDDIEDFDPIDDLLTSDLS